MHNFKTILREALQAGGKVVKNSLLAKKHIGFKGSVDLVTEADKRSEREIIQKIKSRFPDHTILAEESGAKRKSRKYKWIIDPLDGTTNFAHSYPVCCVSIALEIDGEIVLGGVLDPFRHECFLAEKGRGALMNGEKIRVSNTSPLKNSLLATGFPYDRHKNNKPYLNTFGKFMLKCQGVRRSGSAALDLCYLACGRFDGFWELKLHPWDTAAGSLLVIEAGGIVTDFKNKKFSIYGSETLASNRLIHEEMLKVLK